MATEETGLGVADRVRHFILTELAVGRDIAPPGDDDDLLATGVIDSHGVMELVQFLEERFGVTVGDEELVPENFQSLGRIEALVASKQG
jgi:acyl carrier protein